MPTKLTGATERDWLNRLPPMDQAQVQLEFLYFLGSVHYTKLGDYGRQFKNRGVDEQLLEFQDRIEEIGDIIHKKNEIRLFPYQFLVPSGIPQSINI